MLCTALLVFVDLHSSARPSGAPRPRSAARQLRVARLGDPRGPGLKQAEALKKAIEPLGGEHLASP